ncbi:putative 3-beta-hydroxysteroid-Delta(8) [Tieghemostelium lacteum]|uniref:Putative 3-beta-hydroxysteroid-Delta(8) n=1 Tax=Tieghemostelium lacteum TaxID=361077 RepID=A0A152A624_TIELA|nr:putative 3-beta-hydroxysteroid-Delta(8) [Tieghemostelium lacteum]|eukprot:KYR01684.1 putative 3-beta-hydroxysteroid-Delta(8) [Tieghemostelium lacteum]
MEIYAFVPLAILTLFCVVASLFVKKEKLLIFWLLWSGLIHIILEGSYGFYANDVKTISKVDFMDKMFEVTQLENAWNPAWYASLYSQYAKYDKRYAIADPMVVFFCFMELVQGFCCFLLALLVIKQSTYRHALQIFLASIQGLGTVFYFITPYIYGKWAEQISSDPFELWVYVVGLNGLWFAIPLVLIVQSALFIGRNVVQQVATSKSATTPGMISKQQNKPKSA